MAGTDSLLTLLVIGGIGYYVLVLHPEILSSLTPAASGALTPTATCQGKDKTTGAPCDCAAGAAVAYAYKGKAKKGGGKAKGGGKGGGYGGGSQTQSKTQTNTGNCDCSACGGAAAPTAAAPSGKGHYNTGAVGYSDLNGYAGQSIAREAWGHEALQSYYRRYW